MYRQWFLFVRQSEIKNVEFSSFGQISKTIYNRTAERQHSYFESVSIKVFLDKDHRNTKPLLIY